MEILSDLPELMFDGKPALAPQKEDLERLYDLITLNFSTTVLEFGCGYSTFVIAKALEFNKATFEALENKPVMRNSNLFKCFSVDTNLKWIDEVKSKLNNKIVTFKWSYAFTGTYQSQLCSYYKTLPDIVPDFIYLDAPDPKDVRTNQNVNGLSFKYCQDRTIVAADILLMEPTLIPGTIILIDGRTNNARFLQRNLQRSWTVVYDAENDYTFLGLDEPRLGKINVVGRDINDFTKS